MAKRQLTGILTASGARAASSPKCPGAPKGQRPAGEALRLAAGRNRPGQRSREFVIQERGIVSRASFIRLSPSRSFCRGQPRFMRR